LPSAEKLARPVAARGNISIGRALKIVRSTMAADRFDLRTGP
jgi:hypothetical protein